MSSSNNNNKKKGQPSVDPYDALGITSMGATDAEISKAYKKLALKLHPDKQKNDLSQSERDGIAKRFQDIQEAKAFLLDAEHQEDRRIYDSKRESDRLRQKADELREKTMSANRKRMRDELKEREATAKREASKRKSKQREDDLVDQLRRDGKKLREARAEREAEKDLERQQKLYEQQKKDRKATKETLEDRQIRLKWDRKKIAISPSEDSIATLFSKQFGPVESVELLGSKGNQALVTFVEASSCRPCVDEYATSKEMRAKFVGKRKEKEEAMEEEAEREAERKKRQSTAAASSRENESLQDRYLRQAAEREALLRQMEQEEADENDNNNDNDNDNNTNSSRSQTSTSRRRSAGPSRSSGLSEKNAHQYLSFPLPFPKDEGYKNLTPLEKLEKFEAAVLGGGTTSSTLLSPQELQSMQIISSSSS